MDREELGILIGDALWGDGWGAIYNNSGDMRRDEQLRVADAVLAMSDAAPMLAMMKDFSIAALKARLAAAIPTGMTAGKRAKTIAFAEGYLQATRDITAAVERGDHLAGGV